MIFRDSSTSIALSIQQDEIQLGIVKKNGEIYQNELLISKGEPSEERLIELVERAERLCNIDIRQVHLQVPNSLIKTHHSFCVMPLDISQPIRDFNAIQAFARRSFELKQTEVMLANPLHFRVDDGSTLADPSGLYGSKLDVESLVCYAHHHELLPLIQLCNRAGLQVIAMTNACIDAATRIGSITNKQSGWVMLSIDRLSTCAMVFQQQRCVEFLQIPIGDHHFINDLSMGLQLSHDAAETAKLHFGMLNEMNSLVLADTNGVEKHISWRDVTEILNPRVRDLATYLVRSLRAYKGNLSCGITLIGRGTSIKGIADSLSEFVKIPCHTASDLGSVEDLRIHHQEILVRHQIDPVPLHAQMISLMRSLRLKERPSINSYKQVLKNIVGWVKELNA